MKSRRVRRGTTSYTQSESVRDGEDRRHWHRHSHKAKKKCRGGGPTRRKEEKRKGKYYSVFVPSHAMSTKKSKHEKSNAKLAQANNTSLFSWFFFSCSRFLDENKVPVRIGCWGRPFFPCMDGLAVRESFPFRCFYFSFNSNSNTNAVTDDSCLSFSCSQKRDWQKDRDCPFDFYGLRILKEGKVEGRTK